MTLPTLKLPILIQRVNRRASSRDAKGVDALFSFDYMGSAEFEFGALPKALKQMREAKTRTPKEWQVRSISALNATAYYVGADSTLNEAIQLFKDQLKPSGKRQGYTKECTNLRESYFPPESPLGRIPQAALLTCGWWALDVDVPFIFFKEKDNATAWLEAL